MSVNVGDLDAIAVDARQRIGAASDEAALEQVRVELLGKKGALTGALRGLGSLPADQRAAAGARANALKGEIETMLASRARELGRAPPNARRPGMDRHDVCPLTGSARALASTDADPARGSLRPGRFGAGLVQGRQH